ncbi:MAG: GspH/FimT family protein [Desulfobacterales bacterium]|nr:MAG: GspH/FimT family protein [Desulfobacterales bacterium]
MKRNDHGFTVLEIVVVLVLISVIATVVFTRSITTDRINFVGQADKIIAHLHYARSMALKRNEVWGIFNTGNEYWLFQWKDPNYEMNRVLLPGCETEIISLTELNLTMESFILYFDGTGRPYEFNRYNPLNTNLAITIENSDRSQSKVFNITPETGLIRQ